MWSYGTGNPGTRDGELFGPHTAEENPFNPDEILVAEQYGCDILIINKRTGKLRVVYGKRGVRGTGALLREPLSAHFMPSGPYEGNILISDRLTSRILILDKAKGTILWSHTSVKAPMDAIYWDDDHIMVSDLGANDSIHKIRLSDGANVWKYNPHPYAKPFYLQKIAADVYDDSDDEDSSETSHSRLLPSRPDVFGISYGGDLLIGFWGKQRIVREIRTSDKATVWEYGTDSGSGDGDLYDRLFFPVRAFRYGMNETGNGLTIICDERSRIFCVNMKKELIWDLGGSSPEDRSTATPHLILPTYISATRRGTLLITDWGRNMIYEINPFLIPERKQKDAYLFKDHATTDTYMDSGIIESRGFINKNIQIFNKHERTGLEWRILGSYNADDWQVINAPSSELAAGEASHIVITAPWNFIKTQTKSASAGNPGKADVFITMRR